MATLSTPTSNAIQDTVRSQQGFKVHMKRPRPKSVTWAADDKLYQVRLFAAEDAPSLSGSVLQDLLEAKKSKFMHASIPVSVHEVPPGFENVSAKRAKLDTSAALTMATQIPWRCPEKFVCDPSWQVANGDESSEGASQAQRDVRVLEAIYPRLTTIPASSVETQELQAQLDESHVPEIPLNPIEDEEEGGDDHTLGDVGAGITKPPSSQASDVKVLSSYPPGYSSTGESQYSSQLRDKAQLSASSAETHPNTDSTTGIAKNADPDVAAAAAAAYAVLKAKESGASIDHDLLIKILNNPALIETLTTSNPGLKSQFGDAFACMPHRENEDENGLKAESLPPFEEDITRMLQGRQRTDHPLEGKAMPGFPTTAHMWGMNANSNAPVNRGFSHEQANASRGMMAYGHHEQVNTSKGMVTHGTLGRSYSFTRQDMPRDVAQPHGIVGPEPQLPRQNGLPILYDEVKTGGHERLVNLQPWLGNSNSSNVLLQARNPPPVGFPQDRPSGTKKRCFFFNTSRGCRNGAFCSFVHESLPEKSSHLERTNSDVEQQIHASKAGATTRRM